MFFILSSRYIESTLDPSKSARGNMSNKCQGGREIGDIVDFSICKVGDFKETTGHALIIAHLQQSFIV
jgi:hypothetical protein